MARNVKRSNNNQIIKPDIKNNNINNYINKKDNSVLDYNSSK